MREIREAEWIMRETNEPSIVINQRLVRCKNCINGVIYGDEVECTAHKEQGYDPEPYHPLDWFCADGEWKGEM